MGADAIINEVKASNLRGRGGAGFPTGMKWSFVPKQSAKPKYVLCNGDESEPGTCKDRLILEHDPHSVIEGVMIAALAVGSHTGYIYIRGEYRYLSKSCRKRLRMPMRAAFWAKTFSAAATTLTCTGTAAPGAYEVGEESALMESLEGKRGIPRIRPPFPAVVGLWGGPTVINNVETLASVSAHHSGWRQWYADSGNAEKRRYAPVLHERPSERPGRLRTAHGIQPEEDDLRRGGGIANGRKLKAVTPGGSSTPVLTADEMRRGHGLRSVDESRLHARLRRSGGVRR